MTDDEAFVRAVVDRPGDDTPRLVYADWLDERGDRRGAYLRAEAATPGDAGRLAAVAAGLDRVWVAQVSRPPVGVCCDVPGFVTGDPPAAAAEVERVEARLKLRLPADYRAFLLNYNGGGFRFGPGERDPQFAVIAGVRMGRRKRTFPDIESERRRFAADRRAVGVLDDGPASEMRSLLPIGSEAADGITYLLHIREGERFGAVCRQEYWLDEFEPTAESFAAFFATLIVNNAGGTTPDTELKP